jgi:hypothetical protein
MFLKIGQPYTATLLVKDINGNRVLNDTPVIVLQDTQRNLYFNGMMWQTIRTELVMPHIDNGVYSRQFMFSESGVYKATISSTIYSIIKTETIEIYDTNLMRYSWMINNSFLIKYVGQTANETVQVKISRDVDAMYWNGTDWIDTETLLSMSLLSDTLYSYSFVPTIESEYSITVTSGDNEIFYIVTASTSSDNIAPVYIDSKTFRAPDGTTSTLLDENGLALYDVQISVFNMSTKEIVGKAMSNSTGDWNILIKPGTYYFMFEKDGYMSISMERTVM